jgi:hypothetical protein
MSPLFPLFTGPVDDKREIPRLPGALEQRTFVNSARDKFPTIAGPDERSL